MLVLRSLEECIHFTRKPCSLQKRLNPAGANCVCRPHYGFDACRELLAFIFFALILHLLLMVDEMFWDFDVQGL